MTMGRDLVELSMVMRDLSQQLRTQIFHLVPEESFESRLARQTQIALAGMRGGVLLPQPKTNALLGGGGVCGGEKEFRMRIDQHQRAILLGGQLLDASVGSFDAVGDQERCHPR